MSSTTNSSASSPFASPSAPPTTYATLSFHRQNVIRLLNFPQDLAAALEAVILASWPPGLESQGPFGQSYEYKVKGSPFGHFRSQQHVGSVRLLRDVLAFLYSRRWELVAPVLCSRRYTAKDSLIFRQVAAVGAALPPVEWLSLAPAGTDKLRVVYDAPGVRLCGTESDQDHLGVLILSLKKVLQESDYFDKGDWSHDSFVFDLKGRPWQSRGEASVKMRVMLMRLLETMETHGWRLYTAFVHRTGTDELRMLDTWYFVRERGGTGKSDS